jgi:hypothetical protein
MKTAKEEAQELVDQYLNQTINFPYIDSVDGQCIGAGYMTLQSAKYCALIAVSKIMKALTVLPYGMEYLNQIDHWTEVENEIINL